MDIWTSTPRLGAYCIVVHIPQIAQVAWCLEDVQPRFVSSLVPVESLSNAYGVYRL